MATYGSLKYFNNLDFKAAKKIMQTSPPPPPRRQTIAFLSWRHPSPLGLLAGPRLRRSQSSDLDPWYFIRISGLALTMFVGSSQSHEKKIAALVVDDFTFLFYAWKIHNPRFPKWIYQLQRKGFKMFQVQSVSWARKIDLFMASPTTKTNKKKYI